MDWTRVRLWDGVVGAGMIKAPSAERRAPSAERRAPSAERRAPSAERRAPSAMTAPRARGQSDPPSPPDRRPPRRGGGSSPSINAASAAGRRVPPVARHGLVRSARALAAAARRAPSAEAMTAPRAPEQADPPSPPDLHAGRPPAGAPALLTFHKCRIRRRPAGPACRAARPRPLRPGACRRGAARAHRGALPPADRRGADDGEAAHHPGQQHRSR